MDLEECDIASSLSITGPLKSNNKDLYLYIIIMVRICLYVHLCMALPMIVGA